jgi:hypothetical protein
VQRQKAGLNQRRRLPVHFRDGNFRLAGKLALAQLARGLLQQDADDPDLRGRAKYVFKVHARALFS